MNRIQQHLIEKVGPTLRLESWLRIIDYTKTQYDEILINS